MKNEKQPVFYISHGGGPCFWMDWGTPDPFQNLAQFLKNFQNLLPQKPDAILVVSAHWEENEYTLQTHPNPPMLYDYYGFPEHTYHLKYPGKTSKNLEALIENQFAIHQTPLKKDSERGYDHGLFVPFLLMFPEADIPIMQLSIKHNLDPKDHYKCGEILSALREKNILIVGSGLSYHNLRNLVDVRNISESWNNWLNETLTADQFDREKLFNWKNAPNALLCHPREDHLVPLFVAAGAATDKKAVRVYNEKMSNWKFWTSSFMWK